MQVEAQATTHQRRSVLDQVPAPGLVLGGIATVQVGAAFAIKLFAPLGPAGTVMLRVLFAAVVLCAISRPVPREHSRPDLRLAALFGLVLAFMNLSFYEALDRIHLGIAVTLEFVGPLGVALAGSRTKLDVLWAALAAGGVALLGGIGSPNLGGVLFALLAGALWAAYILLHPRRGEGLSGGNGPPMAT